MTDQTTPTEPGVDATVARPGGITYLRIPARDAAESARFYAAVFGWRVGDDPGSSTFSDGTGHVIGHWQTDLPVAGEAGVLPYIYVTDLDETLRRALEHGAEVVSPPYPEGMLRIATVRDPAGNVVGIWQDTPR